MAPRAPASLSNAAGSNTLTFTYDAKLIASTYLGDTNQVNTASVTHYESFPSGGRSYDPTNVKQSATVDPAFPAVALTKTASGTDPAGNDVAYAGSPFPWTLTLVNNGQGPAQTISVQDVLPKNWTFDSGSARVSVGGAASTALVDPSTSTTNGVQSLTWSAGQVTTASPALPGTASGATAAQRTITITFTATPQTAALTDPGVTNAGPPVVPVPHTNTLSATTTDRRARPATRAGPTPARTRPRPHSSISPTSCSPRRRSAGRREASGSPDTPSTPATASPSGRSR